VPSGEGCVVVGVNSRTTPSLRLFSRGVPPGLGLPVDGRGIMTGATAGPVQIREIVRARHFLRRY